MSRTFRHALPSRSLLLHAQLGFLAPSQRACRLSLPVSSFAARGMGPGIILVPYFGPRARSCWCGWGAPAAPHPLQPFVCHQPGSPQSEVLRILHGRRRVRCATSLEGFC